MIFSVFLQASFPKKFPVLLSILSNFSAFSSLILTIPIQLTANTPSSQFIVLLAKCYNQICHILAQENERDLQIVLSKFFLRARDPMFKTTSWHLDEHLLVIRPSTISLIDHDRTVGIWKTIFGPLGEFPRTILRVPIVELLVLCPLDSTLGIFTICTLLHCICSCSLG